MINPIQSGAFAVGSTNTQNKSNAKFTLPQTGSAEASAPAGSAQVKLSSQGQVQDLAQRFDVTNMSDRQMKQFAGELKERGLINEWEFADMTTVLKPIGGSYNPDAPKNFLSQYKAQTEFSRVHSTAQDTKMLEHLSGLLSSMQQARNNALG